MGAEGRSVEDWLQEGAAHLAAARGPEAAACAEAALAAQPGLPAAHCLRGLARLAEDRPAEAHADIEAALRGDRANAHFHFALALCLAPLGRTAEAIAAYRRALMRRKAFPEALANLGNLLVHEKRHEEAAVAFRQALAQRPGDVALLNRLGYCEIARGHPEQGVPLLERAIDAQPERGAAMRRELARALVGLGHGAHAIGPLRRAVASVPGDVEAWALLGEQLYLSGDDAGAIESFDRVLALDPGHEDALFLREVAAGRTLDHPPDGFVARFFDRFAGDFERRLQDDLHYRLPEALAALLSPWLAGRTALRVADLGCGTGLCAPFLRPVASRLVGVDLSGGMLDACRARGLYDELVQDEITRFLASAPASRFDLLVAADVFVYVGRLEPVLQASAQALAPGGLLAFSVESLEATETGFLLRRTGRYAHDQAYIERAAAEAGLIPGSLREGSFRNEGGAPVPGAIHTFCKA